MSKAASTHHKDACVQITSTALDALQCPVRTAPKADTQLLLLDIQKVSEVAGQQVA